MNLKEDIEDKELWDVITLLAKTKEILDRGSIKIPENIDINVKLLNKTIESILMEKMRFIKVKE